MVKAIIIDDEVRARSLLEHLIHEHCTDVHSIIGAGNLKEGVEKIKKEKPQIVFLDIEMPEESGLKVLEYFNEDEISFQIIFVTAYDQYAINAFKLSAIDYLLKPVDYNELKKAVQKAIRSIKLNKQDVTPNWRKLKEAFDAHTDNKITISIPKGFLSVSKHDILFLQADAMYTNVYMQDGSHETICKPLKYFTEHLTSSGIFFKPHRSYLVNINHIFKYERNEGLILSNGKIVPVVDSKLSDLKKILQVI